MSWESVTLHAGNGITRAVLLMLCNAVHFPLFKLQLLISATSKANALALNTTARFCFQTSFRLSLKVEKEQRIFYYTPQHILTNTTLIVKRYVNERTSWSIQFWRPETSLRDALASRGARKTIVFTCCGVFPRLVYRAANSPAELLKALVTKWLNYTSQMYEKSWSLHLP